MLILSHLLERLDLLYMFPDFLLTEPVVTSISVRLG